MNKKRIVAGVSIVLVVAGIVIGIFAGREKPVHVVVEVERGEFVVQVTTSGELRAAQSRKIYAPKGLANRRLGIGSVQITDIVPEGTHVDSGDYVASLDRNAVLEKLRSFEEKLQKTRSRFTQNKLDTAMNLKQARNDLIDRRYTLKEAQIRMEQSKYESPATQRKNRIALEKARRNLKQAKENYQLKKEQAEAKMADIQVTLNQQKRRINDLQTLLKEFKIQAPDSGLVIYHKEWNGDKRQVGSNISSWDMVVATLPDLSSMISETYVNEIDISKVKTGQPVQVSVDAFPDNRYRGRVSKIANVGESLEGTNTKVFRVLIKLLTVDSILRPAMTTKNEIVTGRYPDVVHIPLEALHSNEELTFVYLQQNNKIVRQQVRTGVRNENRIIVEAGLREGQQVLLSVPEKAGKLELQKITGIKQAS